MTIPAAAAPVDRTLVMGVLNVTPDSFSDGGRWFAPEAAIAHGLELHSQGADLVDVGGESTRPGAQRVSLDEELRRVIPVVSALAAAGVRVSVDTMRSVVARQAVEAGAVLINDVSGGQADEAMLSTVAGLATIAGDPVDYVVMHWRAPSAQMAAMATYHDVVPEVTAEVLACRDRAVAAGIDSQRIILDPGYGFAKNAQHNWSLLAAQPSWVELGHRVMVGVSRKRFLGELLARDGQPRPAHERDDATVAITSMAASQGVWAVRVHSVRAHRDAVEVVARVQRG